MTLFFEIVLIFVLLAGSLYFIFDVEKIIIKAASYVLFAVVLVIFGFFIGIGVHWANVVFGW